MENIVIFIIIIIISSIISKNKKKQQEASKNSSEIPRTPSRNTQTQPVTDLRELLKTLKNMNPETAGSKTFSDMNNRADQVKPAGDNEYSSKEKYEEAYSNEEPQKETYSYETADKSYDASGKTYDTMTTSYDEIQSNRRKTENTAENDNGYMSSARRVEQPHVPAPINKHHPKISLLDSKLKLRSAIITSEILRRKYT